MNKSIIFIFLNYLIVHPNIFLQNYYHNRLHFFLKFLACVFNLHNLSLNFFIAHSTNHYLHKYPFYFKINHFIFNLLSFFLFLIFPLKLN